MTGQEQVLIIGGGPSGLAAALLFAELGYRDITVVESRKSAKDFEKNKAFTYQIDGRGQKLLKRLGLMQELDKFGVANKLFHATSVTPDGNSKTFTGPTIDKDRVTCYWTTRRNLQTMLYEAVEKQIDKINTLYDHRMLGLSIDEHGKCVVQVSTPQENECHFSPDILLACDGLSSKTRESMSTLESLSNHDFSMQEYPSPSAKLMYKVLNLPPKFSIKGNQSKVNDHRMAYIFSSTSKNRLKAMALFGFPVANADHPRSVNIIREADHHLWTIQEPQELLDFLTDSFPQLDIPNLISFEEATDFVSLRPGKFPEPQHASSLYAQLGADKHSTHCLLIGDAAHAFPPDLGLGVNSALEDLFELEKTITNQGKDIAQAFSDYEETRLVESKALVKLVQTVFPYQYNQTPWRMKTWVIRFLLQKGLNKILPAIINKPAFMLVQNHELTYSTVLKQKISTDRTMLFIAALIVTVLIYLIIS